MDKKITLIRNALMSWKGKGQAFVYSLIFNIFKKIMIQNELKWIIFKTTWYSLKTFSLDSQINKKL